MRYLEIYLLEYNIGITSSTPQKCCPPKLSFTSNRLKREKTISQAPCWPCLIQCNRCVAPWIFWVHRVSVTLVSVNSLWVLQGCSLPTNSPEVFFTHLFVFHVDGHPHHEIVFLFHSKDTKRYILKITANFIHGPNILVIEVILDIITLM